MPKCSQHDPKRVRKWSQNRPKIVPKWVLGGRTASKMENQKANQKGIGWCRLALLDFKRKTSPKRASNGAKMEPKSKSKAIKKSITFLDRFWDRFWSNFGSKTGPKTGRCWSKKKLHDDMIGNAKKDCKTQ